MADGAHDGGQARRIRVLLVDDQAMVRGGFRMILEAEEDIDVVGEAADGSAAIEAVRRLRPDVVLMDIQMAGMDGLEATRRIVGGDAPGPRVVILTTFEIDEYVFRAIRGGASGFLLKNAPPDDLVAAVRAVADGGALLGPSVTRRLIEAFVAAVPAPSVDRRELASLTEREREVLLLVARGLSNAEIADRLVVGEATVKTHVSNVLAKLELRDRVQAVVFAYESGLVAGAGG
jgi:DNA-binding NarL/FixJ family response regulator